MKDLLSAVFRFDLDTLFKNPTDNGFIQFFRYFFAGGAATAVDWFTLWLLRSVFGVYLYIAVAAAFLLGIITNYLLSVIFVFNGTPAGIKRGLEFLVHLITGLIGLALTEGIIYLFTLLPELHYMIAKIVATAVVFFWNYGSKKIILYRKHGKEK